MNIYKSMRDYFRKKTWLITGLMFVLAFALSSAIVYFEFGSNKNIKTTSASLSDNVSGWAWSPNIGWVSFNCTNETPPCSGTNYGVNIDVATGDFSGNGWSSAVGWVSFNRSDTGAPPDQPYKNGSILANYNFSTGEVAGWAKILAMGDNGWIKLRKFSSDGGGDYGVSINSATGEFSGWAWNANADGSGIGWISFNCSDPGSSCAASNYKVTGNINRPPSVSNMTAPNWSFAEAGQYGALNAKLNWVFNDPDAGVSESAYQIIVNNNNSPNNPLFDSGKCTGYTPSGPCKIDIGVGSFPLHLALNLNYNSSYYWWVKVWDNHDAPSALTQYNTSPDTPVEADDGNPATFTTYKHKMPQVSFSWFPVEPSKGEKVKFTDKSKIFLTAAPDTAVDCSDALCDWQWSATAGAQIDDTATSTPTITLNSAGNVSVTLTVTDNDGYYISRTETINVNANLPKWKEVKPE